MGIPLLMRLMVADLRLYCWYRVRCWWKSARLYNMGRLSYNVNRYMWAGIVMFSADRLAAVLGRPKDARPVFVPARARVTCVRAQVGCDLEPCDESPNRALLRRWIAVMLIRLRFEWRPGLIYLMFVCVCVCARARAAAYRRAPVYLLFFKNTPIECCGCRRRRVFVFGVDCSVVVA
jgi:hypothetical protein